MIPSDDLASRQWFLFESLYDSKADIGLGMPEIWDDYTGRGVTIGIWDDGIEYTHPDLDGSYDTRLHVTLGGAVHDPMARTADSNHGTAVAGLIAADANDGGTVGVAFGARIAGVDFDSSVGTDAITFGALRNFDVVNHSWSPDVGYTFDRNDRDWIERYRDGLEDSVDNGRDGLGTITVFSAGNRRAIDRHTNDSGLTSAAEAIAVGAVGKTGIVSPYSTPGSTLLISAPSSGPGAIWTTDRTGTEGYNKGGNQPSNPSLDHTATFGGTSTAAALTSGVVALMLEANPGLGWRDVQEILAYSARHVGSEVGGDRIGVEAFDWAFNGATTWNGGGLHHSNDYGFGLIDTFAAIRLAERWTGTQTSANRRVETDADWSGSEQVRDGDGDGIAIDFTVTAASDVETVAVDLDFDGGRIADYRIVLVSPDGTRSVLSTPGRAGEGNDVTDWFFASKAFMGEDATGDWRLLVTDPTANGREGTLRGAELIFLGGRATTDDVFVFTDEFSDYAGAGFGHSGQITDTDGGTDILNAAAMRDKVTIDLSTGKGTIDGVALTLTGRFEGALGGDGNDALSGGTAGELLDGGRGDDRLAGGGGDDQLAGGGGNDLLDGGPGNDRMCGGAGDDIFVKRPGEGDDTITDFEKGVSAPDGDKIDISSYSIGLNAIIFETKADGLLIRLGSESVLLQGSSLSALDATDFIGLADGSTPTVALSLVPGTATEAGATEITLTATASAAVSGEQSVAVALSGSASAADFVGALPTSITIADGETSGSVTVTVLDDALVESDETATFTISGPSGGIALGAVTSGSVTLESDDVAPPQDFAGLVTVDRNGTTVTVTATSRDGKADLQGSLSVSDGSLANFRQINIENNDILTAGPNGVDFDLIIWNQPGSFDRFIFEADTDAEIEVTGNFEVLFTGDLPGPSVPTVSLSASPTTGTEAGETVITLTATASAAVSGEQSVAVALSGSASAADFVGALPTSITIADGETSGSVTVTVLDDALVESDETATFTISGPSGGIALGAVTSGSVTLESDDVAPPQDFAGLVTVDRNGTTVTVTATSRDGKADLEGSFSVSDGSLANFRQINIENNDILTAGPNGVDFDLIIWNQPGSFDRFIFEADTDAEIEVTGNFEVLFTGDLSTGNFVELI